MNTDSPPLSPEQINLLPMRWHEGPVHLVQDEDSLEAAIPLLRSADVLGFDIEVRPAFKKGQNYPPSLLQLADAHAVFIFMLSEIGLPESIRAILADPAVIKAGVAPGQDIRKLNEMAPFRAAGFVDLSELARRACLHHYGLRGMAATLLGFRISKSAQRSNWARATLTPDQVRYAATDAWVSRELYAVLQERLARMPAIPELSFQPPAPAQPPEGEIWRPGDGRRTPPGHAEPVDTRDRRVNCVAPP
jgi:ribonuclease D